MNYRNCLFALVLVCSTAGVIGVALGSPLTKWEDYVWIGTTTVWAFWWWVADRQAARR